MNRNVRIARQLIRVARMLVANVGSFVSAFELDRHDKPEWDEDTRTVTIPFIALNVDRDTVYENLQDWQGHVNSGMFNRVLSEHLSEIVRNVLFGGDSGYGFGTKCTVDRIDDYFESSGKVYLYNVRFSDVTEFELERMNDYLV